MGFLSNYKVSTKETQNDTPPVTTPPILVDMPSKPVNFVFSKPTDESLEKGEEEKETIEGSSPSSLEGTKETKGGFSFTPKPSSSGGFSFGSGATSSSIATSSSSSSSGGLFGFNPGSGSSSSSSSGFNPGNTPLGTGSIPFSFTTSSEQPKETTTTTPFSFGATTTTSTTKDSTTPFNFGLGTSSNTEAKQPVGGFSFGPKEVEKPATNVGGFNPGQAVSSFGDFNPGTGSSSSTSFGGFNPGNTSIGKGSVPFSFGSLVATKNDDSSSDSSSSSSEPAKEPPILSSFSFGTTGTAAKEPVSFGNTTSATTESTAKEQPVPSFSFGGTTAATKEPFSSFPLGTTTKEQPFGTTTAATKEQPFSFGFNNNSSENTSARVINFPKNPPISKTFEDMEDEEPMSEITSTPKPLRRNNKKPPNTVGGVSSKFNSKKTVDEEDLLDNDPLVLEEELFNRPPAIQPKTGSSSDVGLDLNRTAPIQRSMPFDDDSFESSTKEISPFAKYLEKTNQDETIHSISSSPLTSKSPPPQQQPPTQSIYQRAILSNISAMEEEEDSFIAERFEYIPTGSGGGDSSEELWWKILHESAEMFLYMQDAFLEDKLDKNILGKTISQFKSIIYQGMGALPSFSAYFDIFSAVDIFYFNRFSRGGLLQKLVKWYIKSSLCKSREDQNIYRLLIIGEHAGKVIEAIKQEKRSDLKTMSRKVRDLYDTFFEILSKRPNIVNYTSIEATFEEYLDEMQVWKRLALKFKREVQMQDDDNSDDYTFLNDCIEIVTGNENIITNLSDNWIELLIGLALYKYQLFADINEIIDLAVHAKNLKEDEDSNFVLEAISLIVFGDNLEETLNSIEQGLARSNQQPFKCYWFMSHVATFFYHINYLYQRIYSATNANSYIDSLHTYKNDSIKLFVVEELLPYYRSLIETNPCENLENDLWKIAIDYLSYHDDESQNQIQEIISNIILNIPITNENQIDKIYRYVKDTPFSKTVCSQLHLRLGFDYISENNFAAGIYHIYKSGNMDELEDVIRAKINTTQNLRFVHYGLEEYSFMIEMPEIQWISSFFKILDNCAKNSHLLPCTLSDIPNSELKLELLMSINLTLLKYSEILSVMQHVEYMEFDFKENNNVDNTKLSTLSELRLLLAQTLQIKILH